MAFKMRGFTPFTQDSHATRPLTSTEKKSISGKTGGIHTTLWKTAGNIGKKIFGKK